MCHCSFRWSGEGIVYSRKKGHLLFAYFPYLPLSSKCLYRVLLLAFPGVGRWEDRWLLASWLARGEGLCIKWTATCKESCLTGCLPLSSVESHILQLCLSPKKRFLLLKIPAYVPNRSPNASLPIPADNGLCVCVCSVTKSCLTLRPQAPLCSLPGSSLSMGFPRQDYWNGLPFPSPENLPDLGSNPCLLHWQMDSLLLSQQMNPDNGLVHWKTQHDTNAVVNKVISTAKGLDGQFSQSQQDMFLEKAPRKVWFS